jgi:hypothetical protein
MANLTPYLTEKYTKMITEITADLGKTADDLAFAQNIVRALKNPDMIVNGFPNLTLDRVQVMETGEIRVIPPPPAPGPDTCTQEKNGKKDAKELVNAS